MDYHLDEVDKQILMHLITNARMPFTEIAKNMLVSAGTIHVRVKKLEDAGIIKGSSLNLDYKLMGYNFVAYIGLILSEGNKAEFVQKSLYKIPNVTVVHTTSGQYKLFCKIRTRDTEEAKDVIYKIDNIEHVRRSVLMVSLDELFNDKSRLMKSIFSLDEVE